MYNWTEDPTFLEAAMRLADYFLRRLNEAKHEYPYVPLWDFDTPAENNDTQAGPLRDTSAGMIAANGMLLLHQILQGRENYDGKYLRAVRRIARETIDCATAPGQVKFSLYKDGTAGFVEETGVEDEGEQTGTWDSILKHATANNNEWALVRYADHGLVYADYYFLELGNKLLRMGLV